MNDQFKTVTSGAGYNHNHMSQGQNFKVFHGVECPRCKHQFLPTPVTSPAKCPACGFEETAAGGGVETETPPPMFKRGDLVRKRSGSQWQGIVVGEYSTTLTPEGYAVESEVHAGSVQIYPAAALELVARHESACQINGQ